MIGVNRKAGEVYVAWLDSNGASRSGTLIGLRPIGETNHARLLVKDSAGSLHLVEWNAVQQYHEFKR